MKMKLFTIILLASNAFNLNASNATNFNSNNDSFDIYDSRYSNLIPISYLNFNHLNIPSKLYCRYSRCCTDKVCNSYFIQNKVVDSYLYHDSTLAKKKDKVTYNITVDQSFTGITIMVKRQGGPNIVPYVIQNYMGRDLAQGELSYAGSEIETTINISSMTKGSYSITVGEGSESTTTFFQVK